MGKSIHDRFKFGSGAFFNGRPFQLDEIMICGTSDLLFTVLKFSDKDGKNIICSVDIEKNDILPLAEGQRDFYNKIVQEHNKRLLQGASQKIMSYKEKCDKGEYNDIVRKMGIQDNVKHIKSKMHINGKECDIVWYSFLCNKKGDTLIASVSQADMLTWLSSKRSIT